MSRAPDGRVGTPAGLVHTRPSSPRIPGYGGQPAGVWPGVGVGSVVGVVAAGVGVGVGAVLVGVSVGVGVVVGDADSLGVDVLLGEGDSPVVGDVDAASDGLLDGVGVGVVEALW